MTREGVGDALAALNATLDGSAAVLLVAGRLAIARRRPQVHRTIMLTAVVLSALFLTST